MAVSDELVRFVREALTRGMPRAQVEQALMQAGWSRDQVEDALAGYADVDFPIPVPRPRPYLSAREAFLYLLLFSTLYISATNLGILLFHFINRSFSDPAFAARAEWVQQSIRWALSSLIVSFPVFVYLSVTVERAVRRDPVKRRSNVRRWLMYLTVFAAAAVLIADFTTLVYNLLGGELTRRFLLKVAAIAAIAGTIFAYYLFDLRLEDTRAPADDRRWKHAVAFVAVAFVAAVVIAGFFALGARPGS